MRASGQRRRGRIAGACVLALAPALSDASEGLASMAAHACDPLRVHAAATAICMRHDAGSAEKYATALATWKARNAAAITRLRAECVAEVRRQSIDQAGFERTLASIDGINGSRIAEMAAEVAAGSSMCTDLLREEADARHDLDRVFPPRR